MKDTFAEDIKRGLTSDKKFLYSKYFYDDKGSKIFQEIMQMPEYYLTDREFEIFKTQSAEIYESLNFQEPFNLIELGAGDGVKTAELIRYLIKKNIDFTYTPIDISHKANEMLSEKLKSQFPLLKISPKTGDYFQILKEEQENKLPSLLLFIGSNIGNYIPSEAQELFSLFYENMKNGDKLLIGVDLKKNPLIVNEAYFDKYGITKRFNLNLLERINRELNADFNLDEFDFYAYYNPENGEVRSYIISLTSQKVTIDKLDLSIGFKAGETIWTELSKKYDLTELENALETANFRIIDHFLDKQNHFTDSLFVR